MGRMLSLVTVGVAATAAAATLLVLGWFARPRRAPYPLYGYAGLAVLVVAELLLFRRVEPVATYFTPIAWTAYILVVDAAVFSLRGESRLRSAQVGHLGARAVHTRAPKSIIA